MTAPGSASEIVKYTSQLDPAVEAFANRAMRQSDLPAVEATALRDQVRARGRDLMNQWANEELDLEKANTRLEVCAGNGCRQAADPGFSG
jgi:predicted ATPase